MLAQRRCHGFSLLEVVVIVIALTILTGFVVERVLPLVGRAQRAAFLNVQRELQSALFLAAAERITLGETQKVRELAESNPMGLLLKPPGNYLGAVGAFDAAEIPRATWYFDAQAGRLAYRVGRYTRFTARDGPADRIELRVAFVFDDRDADGTFNAARDRFDGLRLEPVHAYDWPD